MTAAHSPGLTVTAQADREIVMSRVFNAPRTLVFDAWTKPELFTRWFGPRDWTVPICEIDLRPGGSYRYLLRGPDGAEMVMKGVYREVVRPERWVCTESFEGFSEPGYRPEDESVNTAVLSERDGRTTCTATVLYPSTEVRDAVLGSGMESGAAESMERLAELLATIGSERAQALAATFEQANADAIATVERLSDAGWQRTTGEGWTVAATAHHAAIVSEGIARFIGEVANGTATPRSGMETVNESNARHAAQYAGCSKAEVLDEFQAKGAAVAAIVRGLSDEQLDRTTDAIPGMRPVSAAHLIEMALIGHVAEHVASIKQATGG